MPRDKISLVFFFALLLFVLFQAGRMLQLFFAPLLCALAVAIVCYPVHAAIGRRLKKRSPSFRAFVSDMAVLLFMVVPVGLILSALIGQLQTVLPEVRQTSGQWLHWFQSGTMERHLLWLNRWSPGLAHRLDFSSVDLHTQVQSVIDSTGGKVAAGIGSAARNLVTFLFDLTIFQFVLFFLFRDGPDLYRQWDALLPMPPALKNRLHQRIQGTVEGVVRGAVVVGLTQGILSMIAYFIVGADAAILLGCATMLTSLVPGVGTALIFVPVCAYYFLSGAIWKGVVVVAFGGAGGLIDNVLRPMVVGNKTEMSFLWLTLSVVGGVHVFGVLGLLLGPLIFALLPILFEIYRSYILEVPA